MIRNTHNCVHTNTCLIVYVCYKYVDRYVLPFMDITLLSMYYQIKLCGSYLNFDKVANKNIANTFSYI